ncbi:F-box and associated interaction domains-containing protein [Rhynchospora pubera]|uniref:F-box and associated interaction domains-containing protein n=1 Tax=Rhynchospora pubera TaxID=906938 RepID=A0AAV8GJ05_9POAL|nr:F-box and associated interaction domains-containing protein [Rhynchospora pubera]
MQKCQEKIHDLPTDVITEILLRLPARSLVQVRKVCKLWRSITTTSYFIDMYSKYGFPSRQQYVFVSDFDRRTISMLEPKSWRVILKLKKCATESLELLGSCKGILCLYNYTLRCVELLNPMTCESITIPKPPMERRYLFYMGFDPSRKKFKVICRKRFCNPERWYIYTVGTDARWRHLVSMPDTSCLNCEGIYSDRALHWLGHKNGKMFLYSFDLKDETTSSIDITLCRDISSPRWPRLFELEGSIWLWSMYARNYGEPCIGMLEMNSVLEDQWTWKYSVRVPMSPPPRWTPLLIHNEEIIFLNDRLNLLYYYDLKQDLHKGFVACYDPESGSPSINRDSKAANHDRKSVSCIAFRESLVEISKKKKKQRELGCTKQMIDDAFSRPMSLR